MLGIKEAVMVRVEAHRLAVEYAVRFIVHAMADFEKVETGTNEEPVDVGLCEGRSVGDYPTTIVLQQPTKIEWWIGSLVQPSDVAGSLFTFVQFHHMPFGHVEHLFIYA